jgi:cellulase/cellobiase CelA1
MRVIALIDDPQIAETIHATLPSGAIHRPDHPGMACRSSREGVGFSPVGREGAFGGRTDNRK